MNHLVDLFPADQVDLLPASPADINFLFRLKSEIESIYWGAFDCPPGYEFLKKHYEKAFREGIKTTLIICFKGQKVGVISYRFADNGDCIDYSINVSSRYAGRGLGRAALEKNIHLLSVSKPKCRRIIALIRDDNHRSQRIFSSVGYQIIGTHTDRVLISYPKPIRMQTWVKEISYG